MTCLVFIIELILSSSWKFWLCTCHVVELTWFLLEYLYSVVHVYVLCISPLWWLFQLLTCIPMALPLSEIVLADFVSPLGWDIGPATGLFTYGCMSVFWYHLSNLVSSGYLNPLPRSFSSYLPPHAPNPDRLCRALCTTPTIFTSYASTCTTTSTCLNSPPSITSSCTSAYTYFTNHKYPLEVALGSSPLPERGLCLLGKRILVLLGILS